MNILEVILKNNFALTLMDDSARVEETCLI